MKKSTGLSKQLQKKCSSVQFLWERGRQLVIAFTLHCGLQTTQDVPQPSTQQARCSRGCNVEFLLKLGLTRKRQNVKARQIQLRPPRA